MGRRRKFDMEDALSAATQLFWSGYDHTSLASLTETIGIVPASFYFAFGSKEALFRQVVERYVASQGEAFEAAFQASTTVGGVRALLRSYVDVVTDPTHPPGCLVVNNSPSANADDALRQWLAGFRTSLRVRLQDRFCVDLADGKLPKDFDPRAVARFVVTLAGGLALEARSGASQQDLYAVVDLALKDFGKPMTNH